MAEHSPSESGPVCSSLGLIGTGLFGTALAERLLADGYQLRVYNRTREKADALVARGAKWSDNPLKECRRVVFSLFTTEQVAEVIEHMQAGLEPGQIIIDTSTSDPEQTVALATRLAARDIEYLEAPFSGSSEQARNHQATALVAGNKSAFDACDDLWRCLAAKTFYLGRWGNAAKMKLVTNLVLGLNRAALAEGLVFAGSIGLAMKDAFEVLLQSAAYSRIMEAKGPKMIEGEFTPQARFSQHLKDVRLILEEAARGNTALPLSTVHLDLLERGVTAGLGELDNSAIIRVIRNSRV
jgi:3-hydroxyisobutyrate dehydrogenase-like beta-hydroxyacid dehydrogenase